MSRIPPLDPQQLFPLDWTDTFGAGPAPADPDPGAEGPIFLCGLDDLLARLESRPGYHPPVASGDTLEALADLLADAGIDR